MSTQSDTCSEAEEHAELVTSPNMKESRLRLDNGKPEIDVICRVVVENDDFYRLLKHRVEQVDHVERITLLQAMDM